MASGRSQSKRQIRPDQRSNAARQGAEPRRSSCFEVCGDELARMNTSDRAAFVAEINSKIAVHLDQARRALSGAGVFDVTNVQALADLLSQMEPHVKALRLPNAEVSHELALQ